MKREVFADDEVAETIEQDFIALSIEPDDPGANEMRKRYGVRVTPTSIVVDAEGNVLREGPGKMDKAEFLALLAGS